MKEGTDATQGQELGTDEHRAGSSDGVIGRETTRVKKGCAFLNLSPQTSRKLLFKESIICVQFPLCVALLFFVPFVSLWFHLLSYFVLLATWRFHPAFLLAKNI